MLMSVLQGNCKVNKINKIKVLRVLVYLEYTTSHVILELKDRVKLTYGISADSSYFFCLIDFVKNYRNISE